MPLPLVTVALWAAFAAGAHAEIITGRVVSIADGDTLTLLHSSKTQHKIRLQGIDAPEKRQPFGEASRQNLARLAFQKDARAECPKRDKYGRAVCTVTVNGQDVGLAQLEAGLAWWYRRFAREQTPEQRRAYEQAEATAAIRRVGLWQDRNPVPPWEWRRVNSSDGMGPMIFGLNSNRGVIQDLAFERSLPYTSAQH